MEKQSYPKVGAEDFCGRFERSVTSLIEEPEFCEVCIYYCDGDGTCRWPAEIQESGAQGSF